MNEKHPQNEQRPTEGWAFKQRSVREPIGILRASCSNREETVDDSTLISRSGMMQEKSSLLSFVSADNSAVGDASALFA